MSAIVAGTPLAGHIENLPRLKEICTQHGMWLHVLGYDHFIHCLLEQLIYILISLVSLSSTSHALSSLCTSMDDPEIIVSLHADIEGDCYSLYTRRLSFNCGTCIGPSY